jgi:peptidoglycan/xylan/chitin deacetylase (PgdA/CDA1 family)
MEAAQSGHDRKLCAISVDLDEIPFYSQIHGLDSPHDASANAVFDTGLDRLDAFARANDVPLTLFVIGSTLERKENGEKLKKLAEAGHELGNHTFGHRYDLTRLDGATMRNEIEFAQDEIEGATGRRPVGFRAPGYTVTDELLGLVEHAGFLYDSSVFPCPLYWAAKGAAIAGIRLRGRRSHSVFDTPRVLTAPTRPYRIGHPYWERGGGLLELPIQVTRGPRLPFIGTSVTMGGPLVAEQLARAVIGEPLVNLELHGIDVLDRHDGLEHLVKVQHDVRIAHQRKIDALKAVVDTLRGAGYRFVRLDEAARAFAWDGFA